MTEDEAKTKWCHRGGRAALSQETCIASACMAWRWGQKRNPDWSPAAAQMSWSHPADGEPPFVRDDAQGYCGLAGAPQ